MPLVYLLYGGRKEVIRFDGRAQLAGIRGVLASDRKRVRHVGVGVARRASEADGLGSCQEYRRHYGSVTTTYAEEEKAAATRTTAEN